jgi:Domain of unknown function (DUF4397)
MRKNIRTTLFVLGSGAVILVTLGVGTSVQPLIDVGNSNIAFTNAAQDVGAIDIYVDHELVIEHLANTDPAVHIQLAPGHHLVDVFPGGENVVLIKTTELSFEADHAYQLILTGLATDWSVALKAIDNSVE